MLILTSNVMMVNVQNRSGAAGDEKRINNMKRK